MSRQTQEQTSEQIRRAINRKERLKECEAMLNGAADLQEVGRVCEIMAILDDARRNCK